MYMRAQVEDINQEPQSGDELEDSMLETLAKKRRTSSDTISVASSDVRSESSSTSTSYKVSFCNSYLVFNYLHFPVN